MENITTYTSIIPLLVDYFRLAQAGPYYPHQIMTDIGVSRSAWRKHIRKHIYPKDSEGRKALASVGVSIHKESERKNYNGSILINSIFVKAEPVE